MSARVDLLHQGIVILSVSDRPFDRETPRRRTVASCGKLARNFPADRRLYIGDTMVQYPDLRGGSMLRVNRQEYCYGAAMRLNKFNYYSDFVVYPLAVAALIAADFIHRPQYGGQFSAYRWILACVCGTALWSVLEYGLHRVGLHFMAYFSPMHAQHHADLLGLIGTPAWVSVTVWLGAFFLPLCFCLHFNMADGATAGVMLGYWWYGTVHHVIHHHAATRKQNRDAGYFARRRAWHMRPHHSPRRGNFGVTTTLWDYIFNTAIGPRERKT